MAARGSQGGQLSPGPGAGRHGQPGQDAAGQAVSVRLRQRCPRCPHTPPVRRRSEAMRSAQVLGWGCTQRPRAQGPLSTSQAHRSKPGRGCPRPHPRHTRQLSRAAGASRTSVLRGLDSHCAAGANTERPANRPSRFSGPRAVAGPGRRCRPPRSSRGQRPAGLRLPRRAPRVTLPPARSAAPLGAGMTSVRPDQTEVKSVLWASLPAPWPSSATVTWATMTG